MPRHSWRGNSLLTKIVKEATAASEEVLLNGIYDLFNDPEVKARLGDGKIMTYIYVIGLLNFVGKEVTKENVSKIMENIGVKPDPATLKLLFKNDPKNHLVYLYSIYLLLVVGKEINEANISSMVKVLGLKPDSKTLKIVLGIFNKKYKL